MANEIEASASLKINNGSASFQRTISSTSFTQTAQGGAGGIQLIPTTAAGTALDISAITVGTMGWAVFRNVDTANFIEIGVQVAGTFYAFLKLAPGAFSEGQMNQVNAPFARADTASANLDYWIGKA